MNIKENYETEKDKVIKACLALNDKDRKVLCDYLWETVEFMKKELAGKVVDWSALDYPESPEFRKAFESLADFTISWKYSDDDIIELDKEIIALLQ